jgi:hypothetical protein
MFTLSSWRLGLVSRLVMMLVVVCVAGVVLLASGRDVWLYIDNGGREPMVVTIDGKEEATVEPGTLALIKCQPGEKQILVRSGDKVLFDGVKDLQKSDRLGASRRYLFNPDGHRRYATYTVRYGTDPVEMLFGSKEDKLPEDQQAAVSAAYQDMAGQVELMPADPWFEVPFAALVLTPAPDSVMTNSYTEQRTVLTRVNPKDYALLAAARDKQDPTEEDLDELTEALDRVFDGQP